MTGSRVRLFRASIILGVAAAVLAGPSLTGAARAQWYSDKPPVLQPDDYPPVATEETPLSKTQNATGNTTGSDGTAQSAPRQLGQPAGAVQSQPLPSAGPVVAQPAPVEVSSLGTPEGPPVGTLDSSNGGFSDHVWSGSDRAPTEALLAKAPLVSADPVLRDLNRRLTLTKAGAPPGQAKRAFITVRIERLLDAGFIQEAGAIAAQASVPNDDDFARVQAKAILYANRAQDACGPATATRTAGSDVFWMQLRTYCAAVSGDNATADLTRDVMKAQGISDPAFDTLLSDILTKKSLAPGAIAQPGAIHIFLLQQTGLPVTEAVARKMGTVANLLVARDSRNPPRARFEAVERAVPTGAFSASELRAIADAQELPINRLANAALDAPALPYFMGQVLLRRASTIGQTPEEKAHLMSLALELGEKNGLFALTAAFQGDIIGSIKPAPDMNGYARDFVRALILSKRYAAATAWAGNDPVMKSIIAIASQDGTRLASAQADFSAFAAGLGKNPAAADPDRAYKALVLGIADLLAVTMPPDAKAAAAVAESANWDGARPAPGDMRKLEEAASVPERRGEAILMLTGLVRTTGLRNMSPQVSFECVRLLTAMNETVAARGLAIEALAQYAPPAQTTQAAAVP